MLHPSLINHSTFTTFYDHGLSYIPDSFDFTDEAVYQRQCELVPLYAFFDAMSVCIEEAFGPAIP